MVIIRNFDPDRYKRKSNRILGYDYSKPGAYFVTICTHNKEKLFGEIDVTIMILNDYGKIVRNCWLEIPAHYPNVRLDEFVIMPDHVHGIIIIKSDDKQNAGIQNVESLHQVRIQNSESLQEMSRKINQYQKIIPKSIGCIVRGFKIGVTKWFRQNTDIKNVWQRNFHEHIIRNKVELIRIRQYIRNSPKNWENEDIH